MPDDKDNKKETSKWITIGGKKIEIPAGEEGEEALREKLPSARGMKESNTKQSQKSFIKRFGIPRTLLKIRDEVSFDDYKKFGKIAGFDGDTVKILSEGRIFKSDKDHVFKKSELLGELHWDSMTNSDRTKLLKMANIPTDYHTRNWATLTKEIRSVLKETSPAGMNTATNGVHNPIYNPVKEEKPVSERIKEEIKRQQNSPSHKDLEDGAGEGGGDTGKDEEKGKD